jgi:phage tail sheath protein FI
MATYSSPGVYIEEIPVFPPSVAPVATAIPAFIGYTEKVMDRSSASLVQRPVRITSLKEYEDVFGEGPVDLTINISSETTADGVLIASSVEWEGAAPRVPARLLYHSLQLYFANGGGPCYICSLGDYTTAVDSGDFTDAITVLETVDEPTLLLFPDAILLADAATYGSVVSAALKSCLKMQDRFTIADVRGAMSTDDDTVVIDNNWVTENFRRHVPGTPDELKYGAAYFPYVDTLIKRAISDAEVKVKAYRAKRLRDDGTTVDDDKDDTTLGALNLNQTDTALYAEVKAFINGARLTLPPSGAIAGVYAATDRTRGVWKAPANVPLALVAAPAVKVTNDVQDGLNIDATSGKSVNALRAFYGKGTLVWGARTLAGNDGEWRYVNVRRFANFVEESVQKAVGRFVFEPNDANTWVRVRSMIENFLINQWRDGALMGEKPEHAFRVAVGLGQTMTPQDVIDGYMLVEVHLAIVRPAEFIVLKFMQKMPES